MVMITVGVWSGSGGPVKYTAESLRNSVPYWNGKPIVAYHPRIYDDGYAGNPEVFSRQRIGWVFNTAFDGNRLMAEAWIDVVRVNEVDGRIRDSIIHNKVMEVSTGLAIEGEESNVEWNGSVARILVASKLTPDHLAVLPDVRGACSVADGAGLCRNQFVVGSVNMVQPLFPCY
ncbi:hypothetical protein C2E31_10955 [Rhodopirellula baltica]|nr:hypothetical protein C2E31_10955 [Rhodopirellula baltica]